MTTFIKKSIDVNLLAEAIKNKKITIEKTDDVEAILSNINYFRISGYWKTIPDKTQPIKFSDICKIYDLDSEVRMLIFDLIYVLEIKIRTIIAMIPLNLPKTEAVGNPHFYLNRKLFDTNQINKKTQTPRYDELLKTISQLNKTKSPFVEHFKRKYKSPLTLPIWMVVELLTYGSITTLIKLISDRVVINFLSKQFNMSSSEYNSFLYITNILRNFCAHHNRLYNNDIIIHSNKIVIPSSIRMPSNNIKLWTVIVLIYHVLKSNNMSDTLCKTFDNFILLKEKYNNDLLGYGFPADWESVLRSYCV